MALRMALRVLVEQQLQVVEEAGVVRERVGRRADKQRAERRRRRVVLLVIEGVVPGVRGANAPVFEAPSGLIFRTPYS